MDRNITASVLRRCKSVGLHLLGFIGQIFAYIGDRPLFFSAAAIVFAFGVKAFDSFGLANAADGAVARAAASFSAPGYGYFGPGWLPKSRPRQGQKHIAIATIDRETFDWFGIDGPVLPYAAHLAMVQAVARAKPEAIFLDISYPDARLADRKAEQANIMAALMQGGPGGPAARGQDQREPGPAFNPEIRRLADGIRQLEADTGIPVFVGPVGRHNALAPLRSLRQVDISLPRSGGLEYFGSTSQLVEAGYAPPEDGGLRQPAAPQIWRFHCRKHGGQRCDEALERIGDRSFYIQWGFGVTADQAARLPIQLRRRCSGQAPLLEHTLTLLKLGLFRNGVGSSIDDRSIGRLCTYHDSLPMNAYLDAPQSFAHIFKDRIVLIGLDSAEYGDRWAAPIYDEVPGVAVHAMALDNLIEHQGNVPVIPGKIWGVSGPDALQMLTTISIMALIFSIRPMTRRRLLKGGVDHVPRVVTGMVFILAVAGCLGTAIVTFLVGWPAQLVITTIFAPAGLMAIGILLLTRAPLQKE